VTSLINSLVSAHPEDIHNVIVHTAKVHLCGVFLQLHCVVTSGSDLLRTGLVM